MTELKGRSGSKGSVYTVDSTMTANAKAPLTEDADVDRGQWGSKAEFVLSCIGLSVGLGNIWRFPFLAYQYGGGAFVIPYIILLILAGKPMYFMELLLGQYSSLGPTAVWKCAPIGRGIGLAMCFVSLIVAIYYNVIMAYTLYYFFGSMQGTMPWTVCSSLAGVQYQGPIGNQTALVWVNGSEPLFVGGNKDPIQCMELTGSDEEGIKQRYARVKANKWRTDMRTILKAETEYVADHGLNLTAMSHSEWNDNIAAFHTNVTDGKDAEKMEKMLENVEFCNENHTKHLQNCTTNREGVGCWKLCRCSHKVGFDQTGCLCNGGLSSCEEQSDETEFEVLQMKSSTELYWNYVVLEFTSDYSLNNIGTPRWKIVLCLLLSWLVVFVCLFKGVKSSGKVVYFTATFPYIILIILLINGCLLEGALKGIEYFIVPTWEKMSDVIVWQKAATQMFFSLSVSWGGLIMFGSYNKFKNNVYGDAMLVSILDTVTSIIGGFTIFSVLGNMAHKLDAKVDEVAGDGGFGLAFIVYPQALAALPAPHFWTIIFFFMLFTLGLDSEFALLETVITGFSDEWPRIFRANKALVCGVMSMFCFLLALPCTCQAGLLVTDLLDTYGGGFAVLFIAFNECMCLMWVYGFWNFSKDCKLMLGFEPNFYWIFTWTIAAPVLLLFLFIYSLANYEAGDPIETGIGWFIAMIIMLTIVLYPIFSAIVGVQTGKYKSLRDAAWRLVTPESSWGPADKEEKMKRYNNKEFSEHWKILPECIKKKERSVVERMQSETGAYVNQAMEA